MRGERERYARREEGEGKRRTGKEYIGKERHGRGRKLDEMYERGGRRKGYMRREER